MSTAECCYTIVVINRDNHALLPKVVAKHGQKIKEDEKRDITDSVLRRVPD